MRPFLGVLTLLIASSQTAWAAGGLSDLNGWVESQLASSTGIGSYGLLLLGGVLASLLPCVYPVYPLTVRFLTGRSSRWGRFAHPLVYYIGLAAIYFGFGIIAALSGGAFNEILRLPLANLLIGVLFVLLALSTVDLLHLPLFGGQIDAKDPGLWGSFAMGAGAGLLSSACVGPVVVSILISIAGATSGLTFGTVATAAFKMFGFGLGVGLPILLIGVFGMALPKGGAWMRWVQRGFALLIAYFAWGYLEKAFSGYGLQTRQIQALMAGSILWVAGLWAWQKSDVTAPERMSRSLWGLGAAFGFALLLSALLPASGTSGSGSSAQASAPLVEQKGALRWNLDRKAAYAEAKASGKVVFLDFHGDWCTNCKAFQALTQSDDALNQGLQQAVLLKIYDTSDLFAEYREDPRFPELKVGLPFFVITDAEGNVLYKTTDYTKTGEMLLFLNNE